MKIVSDNSLRNFEFWSGAKNTVEDLTDEQLDKIEAILEGLYPEGMTDTEINDLFWHDRETIYEWAGIYPKFFKLTASCGRVKYVKALDSDDVNTVENCGIDYEEVEENECDDDDTEDVYDFEFEGFASTHYFTIYSRHSNNKKVLYCQGDDVANDLKEAFSMCKIEEISKVPPEGIDEEENWEDYDGDDSAIDEFAYDEDEMWDSYDIPVYAIPRICKLILDPNDELDYYDIPESTAINEHNRYLELDDKDVENIDGFIADLHKAIPGGFTIDWDVESVGSPYFEPFPAFGLGMDCVKLRVYPKNKE